MRFRGKLNVNRTGFTMNLNIEAFDGLLNLGPGWNYWSRITSTGTLERGNKQ